MLQSLILHIHMFIWLSIDFYFYFLNFVFLYIQTLEQNNFFLCQMSCGRLMAQTLDQFKDVQELVLVPTMFISLTMLTIINFDHRYDNDICWLHWPMVCMMIQFVYYTIRVQTICMRYIKNKNLNKMNNYFVKSIFENIFNY
jgi:hypothetical protein